VSTDAGQFQLNYEKMLGMDRHNDLTPRESGLVVGYRWAQAYDGDPWDLKSAADGVVSDDTRVAVEAQVDLDNIEEDPTAFWNGFTAGVVSFLNEQRVQSQRLRRSSMGSRVWRWLRKVERGRAKEAALGRQARPGHRGSEW